MYNLTVTKKVAPQVIFSNEEILAKLDETLATYQNRVVTDQTLKGDKKTLAELNKAKKEVDKFRKEVKKELTAPIEEFEEKCKVIIAKIDEAYEPIKLQTEKFEADRKLQKEKDVKILFIKCKEESTLREEYTDRIELKDEYLNASMTMNKITNDIKQQLSVLALEQQTFDNKVDTVKAFIDILNSKYELQVPLAYENFKHLISLDISELKTKVEELAERRLEQEKEAAEKIRLEAERKAKIESDRIIAEEKAKQQAELNRIEAEKQAEIDKRVKEETKVVVEQAEEKIAVAETVTKIVDKYMPVEAELTEKVYERTITLKATKSQLVALKSYLDASGIEVL